MENNKLQKTQLAVSTIDDVARISKMFYESGMFRDLQSIAQAGVKIMAGSELGITPFQSISGVHIISGKPVIGAGLMASMVDRHPEYDFEVLEQSDKVCTIQFYKAGKKRGVSTFTADDARKAGTQNMGKFPANMLYARAMSNGVKWYCPGVFAGPVYVPEEFGEQPTQDVGYTEVTEHAPEPEAQMAVVAKGTDPSKASDKQKEKILSLLNHPLIARREKTTYLLHVNRYDEAEANQTIEKLQKLIADREEGDEENETAEVMASEKQMQLLSNLYSSHHVPDELWSGEVLPQAEASALIDTMTDLIGKGTEQEKNTPATAEQVADIEVYLENAAFSPDEAQKGKAKLAKGYSIAQANKVKAQLEKLIEERSQAMTPAG